MEQAEITSIRQLAIRLAGTRNPVAVENQRRTARRIRYQATIQRDTAVRLSEVLGTSVDYWPTSRAGPASNATAYAEQVIRQLRAGARLPHQDVLDLADAIEETARYALGMAEELRGLLRSVEKDP